MTGFDPGAIRLAVADQIRGRIDRDVTVLEYDLDVLPSGDDVVMVTDDIGEDQVELYTTTGDGDSGVVDYWLTVEVTVRGGDAKTRSKKLDEFCSIGAGATSSISDAIHHDKTLGMTGINATCLAYRARATTAAEGESWGRCEFPVRVLVTKGQVS